VPFGYGHALARQPCRPNVCCCITGAGRPWAAFVAEPEFVPDLVVDHVLPVGGQARAVVRHARDPARPDFHQLGYDESESVFAVPTFGYFVGPAARIIGTVDGRQVDATVARWSLDKQVVIFWFDPASLAPGKRLDGIVAHDGAGRRL
jgi:hypothetical protein